MANFGTPSAGASLTATNANDTVTNISLPTAVVTASTVLGLAGNDLLYFGAQGYSAIASDLITPVVGTGGSHTGASGTLTLQGSASYSTAWDVKGAATTIYVTGVATSQKGIRQFVGSQIAGNEGNDSIALGNTFTNLQNVSLQGGAGDDLIGTYTNVNSVWVENADLRTANGSVGTASTITQTFVEAGGGNDTIYFFLSGSTVSSTTLQGGAGNDNVNLLGSAGVSLNSVQVYGGGGDDTLSGDFSSVSALTLAGGGGNDTINLSAAINGGAFVGTIYGDVAGSLSQFDGNDTINVNLGAVSSTSVLAGGGNDTIYFSATDNGSNYLAGAAGNDSITVKTMLSASSVLGGAGSDTIALSAGSKGNSFIFGGGDNDTITFTGDAASAIMTATTIFGGLGADTISNNNASITGGGTVGFVWAYSSYAESTLSAMDTIAIGGKAASGTYSFLGTMGGLSQGSFNASLATGTNGVVTFTSTFDTDVTSRASYINSNMTTLGQSVLFKDASDVNYLFIQGGTDDIVTTIGTAGTATQGTLSVAGSRTITINLA